MKLKMEMAMEMAMSEVRCRWSRTHIISTHSIKFTDHPGSIGLYHVHKHLYCMYIMRKTLTDWNGIW